MRAIVNAGPCPAAPAVSHPTSGLAEVAERWLKKGSMVCIEGKLETRSWEKNPGDKRYATDIIASNMQMLGSKGEPFEAQQSTQEPQMPPVPDDGLPF